MRAKTKAHTITRTIGTAAVEILAPNPRRKSFLLSPVVGGIVSATPVAAAVFLAGAGQTWTVPTGVTQMIAAYAWGSGGDAGVAAAGLGGGGGGGGAFASSGPKTVIPGQVWTVTVDAHGAGIKTTVTDPATTVVADAGSGTNAVADVGGASGTANIGATKQNGGAGASSTLLVGVGGGAGGGGGTYKDGAPAVGSSGGAGGGGATLLGYGAGGAGASGTNAGMDGSNGTAPGGGGGGGGDGSAIAGAGADGLAVIFYVPANTVGYVSLSREQNVTAGNGVINYITGATFPTLITDEDVGDIIGEPWFIIASAAGQVVQITEFIDDECDPAF